MVSHPKQSRSQLKIRQILEAARQVLIEDGYQNFTTNHVAEATQCNIGTVYRYYSSKDDVVSALYIEWLSGIQKKAAALVASADDNVELEDVVVALFVEFADIDESEHRLAVELAKAEIMNTNIEDAPKAHDALLRNELMKAVQLKTGLKVKSTDAKYLRNLMLSMMLMVSVSPRRQT